jgi:hypothetical protein
VAGFLEVVTERVGGISLPGGAALANDVVQAVLVWKKTPARKLQQLVYLDTGLGFFLGH